MSMKFGSILRIIGVYFAIIFIAGCAGLETEINSLSFHDGQAESNEQILLRNIIAAAHDKTPTFVGASQVSSTGEMTGGISATFFQHNVTQGHLITPNLTGRKQQNVTILDYGATEAAKILYNNVPANILRQLFIQGWPPRLIETILFIGTRVPLPVDDAIRLSAERKCEATNNRYEIMLCEWTDDILSRCPDPYGSINYLNNGRNRCDFERYQAFINRWDLSGTGIRVIPDVKKGEKAKEIDLGKIVPIFGDSNVLNAYKNCLKPPPGKPKCRNIEFYLRSPKQIIDYLGRLAAMQLYADPPYVPAALIRVDGNPQRIVPFRIIRGRGLEGSSAVSVRVGRLGSYHVPQAEPLAISGDQSLRVMAFVIELQNLARQEAPIQGTGIAILQ